MSRLPQVKGDRLLNALKKEGWYIDRTRGGHVIMRRDDRPGDKLIIPVHGTTVASGTLNNILKKAGITPEELKGLL